MAIQKIRLRQVSGLVDSNGIINSNILPSYVDDVLEYADLASFPVAGVSGKIYVTLDTNWTYRWSGSVYIRIGEGLPVPADSTTGDMMVHNGFAYTNLAIGSNGQVLQSDGTTAGWATPAAAPTLVFNEIPTGLVNDTNTDFELAHTPTTGTLRVFWNGMYLVAGGGNDYTLSGTTITFNTAPEAGVVHVDYQY